MDTFYVFEAQEIGPPLRIPMQFGTREDAQEWIKRRKTLPAYTDVTYTVAADNPQHDAEQAQRFRDS